MNNLLGESAIAAPNIDPTLSLTGRQPIEKLRADELTPNSHHPFVRDTIFESNRLK